jgi:16S rRNA (adenine1518-N6/adenine1519-N6)-dimethyltransferase
MAALAHGIPLKKKFGQHFLRNDLVVNAMVNAVTITPQTSIFEIGCGDGFLTRRILQTRAKQLWVFEIDPDWSAYVREAIQDKRLKLHEENILDVDFSKFKPDAPWIILANLPYQITFPILRLLALHKHMIQEGVVMVQEEVAQKILKTEGRGYGYISIYFQYIFNWKMLEKIPPSAFVPPPKVYSRLLYFTPRKNVELINSEKEFWKFIKTCFRQPRRTLRNNLQQVHYSLDSIGSDILSLRAQQLSFKDLLEIWDKINTD